MCLFLTAESSLPCRLFSSCGEGWGLLCSARFSSHALKYWLNSCGTQAELLHWHVASSQMRDRTCVLCIGRQILYHWATKKALIFFFLYCGKIHEMWHLPPLPFNFLIYFWLCQVLIAAQVFSSCALRGYSQVVVGFSLPWLLLLRSTGSRCAGASEVVAPGL